MAKRSQSNRSNRSSIFTRLVGTIWVLVTAGGVAGWSAPDLPVIGPLVRQIFGSVPAQETPDSIAPEQADEFSGGTPPPRENVERGAPRAVAAPGTTLPASDASGSSRYSPETIKVASFNIQVFGESKLSKTWVVEILAQSVRQFDVVAIQEIRSQKDHIIPQFVESVNADGSRYNYVIGPRLGRTVSTEQYAFLYDTRRIEIDTSSLGTIQDPQDLLHREPFVARFRARTPQPDRSFAFWLVNIHTDPDEVATEVDVLADVFVVMQAARPEEDDVILLGDLNASDTEFGSLGQVPGITWAVSGTTTNTRRSKMYDNILFDRHKTAEYTGRWGVFDLESVFQLTREQALAVSDHLPVWAEFRLLEARADGNMARLPQASLPR